MQETMQFVAASKIPENKKHKLSAAFAEQIWAGEPFEVIDGERMHFQFGMLNRVFQILEDRMCNKPFVVECTLGPQSSGKSTLMNRKYGCSFKVSEGRCTRGVWGQLIRMEDRNILVLDTEGLQSVEKADPEYVRISAS